MKAIKKFFKIILQIILFIISWLLFFIATIVNFIIVAVKYDASKYFRDSALRLDIYGAGEFRTLWNIIFISKDGVKFKSDGNTISAYLGLNELLGKLTWFGKFISFILNILDFSTNKHCYDAFLHSKLKEEYKYLIKQYI